MLPPLPPLPKQLLLTKQYTHLSFSRAVVACGTHLQAGDVIAWCNEHQQPLRAPTAGTLSTHDDNYYYFAPQGSLQPVFAPLPKSRWIDKDALVTRIRDAGVLGMGGACFPTAKKIGAAPRALIINAVECEPGVMSDTHLLANHSQALATGIAIMRTTLPDARCYLAVKQRTLVPKALRMKGVYVLPTDNHYPSGSEHALKQMVIAKQQDIHVPTDIVCLNLATIWAIYTAVVGGYISALRPVTLHQHTHAARVVWAYFGTSYADLLAYNEVTLETNQQLVANGLMMGKVVDDPNAASVNAGTLALFIHNADITDQPFPCIQCNRCAEACPSGLWPQDIYAAIQHNKLSSELGACIVCGMCDFVCPSRIPLVDAFRVHKARYINLRSEQHKADDAARRYEAKLHRSTKAKKHIDAARVRARAALAQQKQEETHSAAAGAEPPTNTKPAYQKIHLEALLTKAHKEQADATTIARIEAQLRTLQQ